MQLKINLSFANNEREVKLYAHCRSKISASAYIKELIEEDMKRQEQLQKELNRTK